MEYLTDKIFYVDNNQDFVKTVQQIHAVNTWQTKFLKRFDFSLLRGMILIIFQKVFDTIKHKITLRKMSPVDFLTASVAWFELHLFIGIFKWVSNIYQYQKTQQKFIIGLSIPNYWETES